jgi:hypothetical protein
LSVKPPAAIRLHPAFASRGTIRQSKLFAVERDFHDFVFFAQFFELLERGDVGVGGFCVCEQDRNGTQETLKSPWLPGRCEVDCPTRPV